jgi:hypothetical protein
MTQAKVTVVFALAIFSFFAQGVHSASHASEAPHLYRLRAETDSFASFCARAGLTVSSNKTPATVLNVGYGSYAYWAGIQKGDRILAASVQQNAITIERDGKEYCAQLQQSAGAVTAQNTNLAAGIPAFNPQLLRSDAQSNPKQPFTPEVIAQIGPDAVRQGPAPNCWFEASVTAMAMTPAGQKLISHMITGNAFDSFTVQFPNDPRSFVISEYDIARSGVTDRTEWAKLLECAEMKKFPDNDSSEGPQVGIPLIYRGLTVLSGTNARFKRPDQMSLSEIAQLLSSAARMKQPVVMATKSPEENGHLPQIVTPNHAYTVLNFDPGTQMVLLRNPYGPIERVNLSQVPQYFRYISWVEW